MISKSLSFREQQWLVNCTVEAMKHAAGVVRRYGYHEAQAGALNQPLSSPLLLETTMSATIAVMEFNTHAWTD